jgi:RecA/RadA recombinase
MNIAHFFSHWNLTEHPFRGEEARHDAVFARVGLDAPDDAASAHADFDKILGSFDRASSSIVFGEKGSGKTAIRMQIVARSKAHNRRAASDGSSSPSGRVFLISYDDLNPFLEQLHARIGASDAAVSLRAFRLVDHLDAILALAVTSVVDGLTGDGPPDAAAAIGPDAALRVRALPLSVRADFRLLAAVYDLRDVSGARAGRLRRLLRLPRRTDGRLWTLGLVLGWMPSVALVGYALFGAQSREAAVLSAQSALVAGVAYLLVALKTLVWDRFRVRRLARRVRRQRRVLPGAERDLAARLSLLPAAARARLDPDDTEASRYFLFETLHAVLAGLGYDWTLVLVDRVDEPTLINGDTGRMQSVVWPMLNNKFLQQDRMGIKMLLPLELRYALFKESSAFFAEARLDKQCLVERLGWTGAMLYDLCSARLAACRPADAPPLSLIALFDEDVTRQDLIDALEQMHQPRDALKFLYRCLHEHCANVTVEDGRWRIPRAVVDTIRRQEVERVTQLHRGIRPA